MLGKPVAVDRDLSSGYRYPPFEQLTPAWLSRERIMGYSDPPI